VNACVCPGVCLSVNKIVQAEYCYQFVCLYVCVCLRAYLWNRWTDLHETFCANPLWPWFGPPVAAFRYRAEFEVYECLFAIVETTWRLLCKVRLPNVIAISPTAFQIMTAWELSKLFHCCI